MNTVLSALFLVLLGVVLLLNWLGLPANWLIIGLILLVSYLFDLAFGQSFWILALVAALAGEALEWIIQASHAQKAGASSAGTIAGMIGAFLGAILGAPFLLGLGAFLGALFGAFGGCLTMELLRGEPMEKAIHAAKGTLMGRFLGSLLKCAAGLTIILLLAKRLLMATPEVMPQMPGLVL